MFTVQGTIKYNDEQLIEFQETGYVSISDEQYGSNKTTLSFSAIKNKLILAPKYLSDTNYLYVSISGDYEVSIGAYIKGVDRVYTTLNVSSYIQELNILDIVNDDNRITFTMNGQVLYKLDSALFGTGAVKLYGEAGEVIHSCIIKEKQSTAWKTNVNDGDVEIKYVIHEDIKMVKIISPVENKAKIYQELFLPKGPYMLSLLVEGAGDIHFKNSDGIPLQSYAVNESAIIACSFRFDNEEDQDVVLSFETDSTMMIGCIQLEPGTSTNEYLPNASTTESAIKDEARLAYPMKDEYPSTYGSLFISLTAPSGFSDEAAEKEQMIFRTEEDHMKITYQNKAFRFYVDQVSVEVPYDFKAQQKAELVATWDNKVISLHVNEESCVSEEAIVRKSNVKTLVFAEEESISTPIILEEWALFNYLVEKVEVKTVLPTAIMHSLFDGGISGKNVTWSEIPVAPNDHSPILVQKENGETLQKVSFFNYETAAYETYNTYPFMYDGKSDYVEVAHNNLDEEYRGIAIKTVNGETIGQPYRVDGKRIYFSLDDHTKRTLKNATLYATYQVNDTYTIDYNIEALDGYRINFAKHDGGKRIVYQEGNRYAESAQLATMIEMNPLLNQNHEGFLYVTNTVNPTATFRLTMTPDRLHADGASSSTLIVEPLDYLGNFLSHSRLHIQAEKGFVARHISQYAVEAQKRSGQYLYQYFAPYIQETVKGDVEVDNIWITDLDNGIGICCKILLQPVKEPSVGQITNSRKTILSNKTAIIDYLLMYEGIESHEDETLVSILDLNEDGRITTDDVSVLESNLKDEELMIILNKMNEWEAAENEPTTA